LVFKTADISVLPQTETDHLAIHLNLNSYFYDFMSLGKD
jgi:hypothetical protein